MGKTYNISSPPDIRIGKLAKKPEASKIRALFPQVLASTLMNLLMLDVGLVIAYPTILAPARFPDYYQIFEFTDEQKALYGNLKLLL